MTPLTLVLARVLGPLLILRGLSILIDRSHFESMLEGLEREVETISFSMVPVFLFAGFGSLLVLHWDFSSLTATLITLMALGGTLKTGVLILFPGMMVAKAQALGRHGFLHVVCVVSLTVGAVLAWTGWSQPL